MYQYYLSFIRLNFSLYLFPLYCFDNSCKVGWQVHFIKCSTLTLLLMLLKYGLFYFLLIVYF